MTKKYEKELTDRQKKALPFFISCKNHEEACRAAGISKNAFYTWLQNSEFKKELSRHQEEAVQNAVQTLKSNMTHATNVLVSLLDRKDNPALLRSVCNDIIEHVSKFREFEEIEQRLAVLENRVNNSN